MSRRTDELLELAAAFGITRDTFRPGSWITDPAADTKPRWGDSETVWWATGEACLVAAPTGVGKTTLSIELVRGALGLVDDVLGLPVRPARRVLYLALDRPAQIRRAAARRFTADELATVGDRLAIWTQPVPFTVNQNPDVLAMLALAAGADLVIVDSLKDTATALSDDVAGLSVNRALQSLLGLGIDVLVSAHLRKGDERPRSTADLFGSSNIANGAGSVLLLWGTAGSGEATLSALKSPTDTPDELAVDVDYETGQITRSGPPWDPAAYLRHSADHHGATVAQAAQAKHDRTPSRAETQSVRRQLDRLVDRGLAHRVDGTQGGRKGGTPARYFPIVDREEPP